MTELQPFTVVGVYEDNGQPFAEHQKAEDAEHAARLSLEESKSGDLIVLCVFVGTHQDMLQQSSDDTGYCVTELPQLSKAPDA